MKYIFKQIDDISGNKAETTIEFTTDYLPTILEHFEMFLRGSGFHPSGTLDFVNYDDCELEFPAESEAGCFPDAISTIARRHIPIPMPLLIKVPLLSGPRCLMVFS